MTKILLVTRGLPLHGLGGMETITWDLAKAFALAGAEVTVLTTAAPGFTTHAVVEDVAIHFLDAPSGRYSPEWWRESAKAYSACYANSIDVVLSVSAGARSIGRVKTLRRPLMLIQAHGTAWGELRSKLISKNPIAWLKSIKNLFAMIEDSAYRNFDAFIAVGKQVEKDLKGFPTQYVTGKKPIYLISNGVSEAHFAFNADHRRERRAALGLNDNDRLVLSASRLHQQKGIVEGLEGFLVAAKNDPNLHLAIAGSGPDEARIKSHVDRSELKERVHFVGLVPRHDLPRLLSAADVFLFTTLVTEGLPLNLLEARASGLPIVASQSVSSSKFGSIPVQPTQPDSVSAGIIEACSQISSRKNLLPPEFSLSKSSEIYLSLFDDLMKGKQI